MRAEGWVTTTTHNSIFSITLKIAILLTASSQVYNNNNQPGVSAQSTRPSSSRPSINRRAPLIACRVCKSNGCLFENTSNMMMMMMTMTTTTTTTTTMMMMMINDNDVNNNVGPPALARRRGAAATGQVQTCVPS